MILKIKISKAVHVRKQNVRRNIVNVSILATNVQKFVTV